MSRRSVRGGTARHVWRAALAAVIAVALAVPAAWADGVDGFGPGGFDTFGFGLGDPVGIVSPDGAWGIVESDAYGLADVDPLTGAVIPGDVTTALSPDAALTYDLMADQALAFDALRLAEDARRQAEAKRKAMEAAAARRGIAFDPRPNPGAPAEWELKNFSACGSPSNTAFKARIETVDAFEIMCADAAADGAALVINSAYRDPARQNELWRKAVAKYGSASAAAKWVARPTADGGCSSKHCAGIAIDVTNDGDAGRAWMHRIVGCYASGRGLDRSRTSCAAGERPVKQVQLYGFILPMAHEPWHVELGIPVAAAVDASCDPPRSYSVPQMVAAIFRCRLAEAGITGAEADRVVWEALLVSKCESGWNPEAVAFGGKYVNTPNPATGSRYTAAGVFQFIRSTADKWVSGGYANVRDPVANIDAAARLYLANRGGGRRPWADWACAMANDGFAARSVLPGYPGGPADFPAWVKEY